MRFGFKFNDLMMFQIRYITFLLSRLAVVDPVQAAGTSGPVTRSWHFLEPLFISTGAVTSDSDETSFGIQLIKRFLMLFYGNRVYLLVISLRI